MSAIHFEPEERDRGVLVTRNVVLPWSGCTYTITQPSEIDSLLDQVADDPEQNLPYWAEAWPSGLALADMIEGEPGFLDGQRAIEIGCGLGLTAIAALRAGAALTVTDYARPALELCQLNCQANAGKTPTVFTMNWRRIDESKDLTESGRFPVVLAADVLYERRDIDPMLDLISTILAPGGVVWLAEPGRPVAAEYLLRAELRGWRRRSVTHPGPWPEESDAGVVVGLHELRWSD